MLSRTRTESQYVAYPKGGFTGINYTPSREDCFAHRMVDYTESITWSGNGKSNPHTCTARKGPLYGEYQGAFTGAHVQVWEWNRSNKNEWKVRPRVLSERDTFACSGPTITKTVGPSDDDIASRINDACVSLSSLPVRSMMNLPQAIIELKDIPRTIKAVPKLYRFLGSAAAAKRGLTALNSVKEIASAYLACVFGIKPTVNDVNNFIGQVPSRVKAGVRSVRYTKGQKVRAGITIRSEELPEYLAMGSTSYTSSSRRYAREGYVNNENWDPFIGLGFNSSSIAASGVTNTLAWPSNARYKVVSREVTGCVFGRVANDFSADISAMDDITFNADLLSTAWELVPFSFVVDWFVDLGKWIRQANKLNDARRLGFHLQDGIWLSQRVDQVEYHPCLGLNWQCMVSIDGYYVRFAGSGTKYCKLAPYVRERSYDRNYLMDNLRFPKIDLKGVSAQGAFQWASGIALAIQACGG